MSYLQKLSFHNVQLRSRNLTISQREYELSCQTSKTFLCNLIIIIVCKFESHLPLIWNIREPFDAYFISCVAVSGQTYLSGSLNTLFRVRLFSGALATRLIVSHVFHARFILIRIIRHHKPDLSFLLAEDQVGILFCFSWILLFETPNFV